jgi:FdhD protein
MQIDSVIQKIDIIRIKDNEKILMKDAVIDEDILSLVINGDKAFEMVFSMTHPRNLAAGFLFTQGIVHARSDIQECTWQEKTKTCHISLGKDALARLKQFKTGPLVKGSSGGSLLVNPAASPPLQPDATFRLTPDQVLALINQHWDSSKMFHKTGALHSAGLCSPEQILFYFEDIGRHNAVDKLAGHLVLNQTRPHDKVATLSCRMSLEIIGKLIKTRIPVVISNAAPTLSAVRLADAAGLTIIGFARDRRFNIYTHADRILTG